MNESDKNRFLEKILKSDGCWQWIAASRGNGYGCMKVNRKVIDAHRLSWEIHFGKIPDGLLVCHTCDNKKCVNPAHLFLGTHSDNMQDCLKKGRLVTPKGDGIGFQIGHTALNGSLSTEEAKKIKKYIFENPKIDPSMIAMQFNVKSQLIKDIKGGRSYKNINFD